MTAWLLGPPDGGRLAGAAASRYTSVRIAMTGSTREARRAGRYVASSAMTVRPPDTTTYVTGSRGPTPNRNDDITRVSDDREADPEHDPVTVKVSPSEEHPPHVADLRAERQAKANFTRSLGDGVGNHSVDPNHADEQRHTGGDR